MICATNQACFKTIRFSLYISICCKLALHCIISSLLTTNCQTNFLSMKMFSWKSIAGQSCNSADVLSQLGRGSIPCFGHNSWLTKGTTDSLSCDRGYILQVIFFLFQQRKIRYVPVNILFQINTMVRSTSCLIISLLAR